MEHVKIFTAGVAAQIVDMAVDRLKSETPTIDCEVQIGGSADGINALLGGERFDVMILADASCINEQLMPDYVAGYRIWGGNEMVVTGEGIGQDNWKDVLLASDSEIRHMNPYNDPGGYRAVMAMKLADRVEPGLSNKLLYHPNYRGLDKSLYGTGFDVSEGADTHKVYQIVYKSLAVSRNESFAVLPPVMNQGDPTLEDVYKTVSFTMDDNHTVHGSTILHGILIPKTAENPSGAEKFVKVFLSNRFRIFGFTPVERNVGEWGIKPANMWDAEAHYYNLMTLMEVNGTSKQIDAMPLDRDDVVLDCGCGPGRVAIQVSKRVKKVICLDSSERMLAECRKNCESEGVTNVEYILADWQEAEIGRTIPEVDVVIQSRGGGGPSSLEMLRKAARKYAVSVMWSDGAPCIPESQNKLFVGCYSPEAQKLHPELKPFQRPIGFHPSEKNDGRLFGGKGPVCMDDKLPMDSQGFRAFMQRHQIKYRVTTVEEGWDRLFASKEEAYDWLIQLSKYPEFVNLEKFHANVDKYLSEREDGWYFFLPTSSDVAWFKTR